MTFPLGRPTNRPPVPDWEPIAGRPNWIRNRFNGQERYVEPPKQPPEEPDEPLYPYVSDEE